MRTLAAALILLASTAASPAAEGTWISGRLEEGDMVNSDGRLFESYVFFDDGGDAITIDLESTDFDPILFLNGVVSGGTFTPIEDDDGGGNRNARITTTLPPQGGVFTVQVSSYPPNERRIGAYRVRLSRRNEGDLLGPMSTLDMKAPRAGVLSAGDVVNPDGSVGDMYLFLGPAEGSRTVEFAAEGSDFSPYLIVQGPNNGEWNADGAGGRTARARVPVGPSDFIVVSVTSSGPGLRTGSYSIRATATNAPADPPVGAAAPKPPVSPAAAAHATTIDGRLDTNDRRSSDGKFMEAHPFRGRRGERVTIRLESTDFDPVLYVVGPDGFVERSDDADGRNSLLDLTLPADGTYHAVAAAFSEGNTGAYRLTITRP